MIEKKRLIGPGVRGMLAAAFCLMVMGSSSGWAEDRVIGDGKTYYVDPEIWGPTRQIVWQDFRTNQIWLANINPETGELVPPDGRGLYVGKAAPIFDNGGDFGSNNGPEWGLNGQGLFVYMTSRDQDGINQTSRFGPLDRGTPQLTQLTSSLVFSRGGALPTVDPDQPQGATLNILYDTLPRGRAAWRFDNSSEDHTVPIFNYALKGPRWVPDEFAIATNVLDGRLTAQAAIYDVVTEETKILTNDGGSKSDVSIFYSPELGRRAMVCVVGRRKLAVYAEAEPYWEKIKTFNAPFFFPGGLFQSRILFPGQFVYQGKSYFYFAVGNADITNLQLKGPTQIFVVGLDGDAPVRVSNWYPAGKIDPEVVIMNNKPFLYYYTVIPPGNPTLRPELHVVTDFLP